MTFSQDAARFITSLTHEHLPAEAIDTTVLGFTDTLAALIAGRPEPVTRATEQYLDQDPRQSPSDVRALLGERLLPPEQAALLDAVAAHALDYDDYAFANHPSSVMVPAILAIGQSTRATGREMITAYIAGYEVWAEIMAREPDHLHSKGWHPTAVFGPIGATAAVARVLKLSIQETSHALGLSVAHAGGVMGNFGSMAKPYHAGRAAEAGLRCARLARAGMTASAEAIDGGTGLLAALSPGGRADRSSSAAFGQRWRITETGLNIKKYPTVGASQRVVDGILGLTEQQDIDLSQIETIVPRVSDKYARLMHFSEPRDPAEAKFSLAFACSAALRFGRLGLSELEPAALADPMLRDLMSRVDVDAVEEYDPDYPVPAPYDMVTLIMKDGRKLATAKIRRASGHVDHPLTLQQLRSKFMDCASYGKLSDDRASALFESVQALPAATSPDCLMVADPDQ
ncbi:MAG: MmgE/PrpD family protein [Alphaproteobacteria bacterium]|nr:MmgE/PrpD family protein [Alphaproteobacteria bacterium]